MHSRARSARHAPDCRRGATLLRREDAGGLFAAAGPTRSGDEPVIYREAGQFKTSYAADQAVFPIAQDRWFVLAVVAAAFVVPPLAANEYWLQAVLIPLLVC